MFWRFGFHACSAIDTLLDKPDVTLEEILGEDDLLQECKAHNTKLIEYLRDPNILAKLLNYIIADEQIDDKAKFKYSYVSCEVLSCEIWSICETVVQSRELLSHFWTFLDRPTPLNPLQASYFTKVNEQFLEKKTDEMIPFIQSIPDIVSKLLRHIETSAIMDLLLKIISMEKSEPGSVVAPRGSYFGAADANEPTCRSRGIAHDAIPLTHKIQGTAADVLKAIIAISANSSDAGVIGPNALSRELVSEETISRILEYMLDPDGLHSTASLTNCVALIIELIRKNNSDYDIEPVLSLTLESHPPTSRDSIYLGTMLRLFASRIHDFQSLLSKPKTVPPLIATTFGNIEPLGFERFRICELYAELLHCSNMALLNDPRGEIIVRERDMERERLQREGESKRPVVDLWGDTTLRNDRQWAADPYSSDDSDDGDEKDKHVIDDREMNVEQPRSGGEEKNPPVFDEPSGGSQQVNGGLTENLPTIHVEKEKQGWSEPRLSPEIKSSESGPFISPPNSPANHLSNSDSGALTTNEDKSAMESGKPSVLVDATHAEHPVVGDYLKMKFVEARVLPSVVDLFFAHPWNNFLHNVVYDILTQVLNGPMDKGFNRQLAIDLFTTGQLTEKILDGQRASDEAQAKDKGVRLGYMGHLTLIAEEVLKLAERIPLELLDSVVVQKLTARDWNEYVDITLTATRTRDNAILGGVRPQPSMLGGGLTTSVLGPATAELAGVDDNAVLAAMVGRGLRYENRDSAQGDEDFGGEQEQEPTDEPFVRYMSQNLANDLPDKFGSSDEDEDDEEVVGWMGESGEFEPRARNNEDVEDEEEHVREFGRRGLFNEPWESDFHHENDDEYEFRGIGAGLSVEEQDLNSSDDEDVGEGLPNPGGSGSNQETKETEAMVGVSTSIKALELDIEHANNDRLEQEQPETSRNGTQSRMNEAGELPLAYTQLSDAFGKPTGMSQGPAQETVPKIRSDDVD